MSSLIRGMVAVAVITLSSAAYGGWEYNHSKDPFDDTDRSAITPSWDMYGREDLLVIVVSCQFDGLNILLSHTYMAGDLDEEVRVEMRVDQSQAYGPKNWSLTLDNEGSYMPISDVPIMIAQLKAGNRLIMRVVDPVDGETLNQSVSLVGFGAAVKKLSCYKA